MSGKTSIRYDWLQLIEISGPFLSTTVLNEAFPDGLDGFDKRVKRDLSRFYSEWVEAAELKLPDFSELHTAWIRAVLRDGLEFQDGDLSDGTVWSVAGEGGLGHFSPDWGLKGLDGEPVLFIKTLPADVKPEDRDTSDEWKDTVIEKMTRLCRVHEVRLGLVTNGEKWILVNAAPGGTLSGAATWYARLWFQEDSTLRAFLALVGYRRFAGAPMKRLPYLLDESLKHLEEVTDTLGKQVMTAVEVLMEGFDRADLDSGRQLLAGVAPATLYEAALTVMMRLVFLLCAEERGLMLLGEKKYDDVYAVSTLRRKLEEEKDKFGAEVLERRYDAWARLLSVFRLVYSGVTHPDLRFPAMGGSLFNPDKYPFLEGRQLGLNAADDNPPPLPIDNRTVLLILESLQVLKHRDGAIPLSFRSLDVEQIGYIYEGLLEFTGARAEETLLGVKGKDNPEIALPELESLRLESEEKLIARMQELTERKNSIVSEYAAPFDEEGLPLLLKVCHGDAALVERLKPFANWLRRSEWNEPVVYLQNSFYVTEGRDRRSTGTHYTPKSLTEMIVKEALEPVVYVGPAEGKPRGEWQLKSPAELLNLKICDIAMGSGAFLVQACRYVADRLVDSWSFAENAAPHKCIDSQGRVVDYPPPDPMSKLPDDRLCEARRLIAEKCLYGVDINPLAVELAKLSLWLVTISKNRPFGFLDHNLKSGDSLLGVTDVKQLATFRIKPDAGASGNLMTASIENAVAQAAAEREAIRNARTLDIRDIQLQMQHHQNAEKILANVRAYADYFIGEVFVLGKPTKKTNAALDAAALEGASLLGAVAPRQQDLFTENGDAFLATQARKRALANLAYDLPAGQTAPRCPFHWALEFPEVFAQGGFGAIVGNPPFSGGKHLSGNFGSTYRDYLIYQIADGIKGSADFVSYFFLRAFLILKNERSFGLIACNTISEGDTRQVGLERMVQSGATIISAHPNMPWPGTAGVAISPITIFKETEKTRWRGSRFIDGMTVPVISAYLSSVEEWSPKVLAKNADQSFQGSIVLGLGFVLTKEEAEVFIRKNPKNKDVLFPYINGEDVNTNIGSVPSRWIINFFDWPADRSAEGSWNTMDAAARKKCFTLGRVPSDYPGVCAMDYPDLFAVVDEKVRPERQRLKPDGSYALRAALPIRWWQYCDKRPALYHAIGRGGSFARHPFDWDGSIGGKVAMICSITSKHLILIRTKENNVFSCKTNVFTRTEYFPLMQSSIHEAWVRKQGSTLETRMCYTPTDCYETYPFPCETVDDAFGSELETLRNSIMTADQIGLTQLYNRFHDPSETDARFVALRALQVKIDNAVRDAYGWTDIDLGHDFHEVGYLPANDNVRYTISEEARIEVLKRLAKLNKERWEEEEAAGLHKKGKKR